MDLPPREPFLTLLQHAKEYPEKIIIADLQMGIEANRFQFLTTAVNFRNKLKITLGPSTVSKLEAGNEDVFICVLAPAGWEFAVAMLAIKALGVGGAVTPISPIILPEEAKYILSLSKADAVIYSSGLASSAKAIEHASKGSKNEHLKSIQFIEIVAPLPPNGVNLENFHFNSTLTPSERAELVLHTSGTTGKPKGVVYTHGHLTISNVIPFAPPPPGQETVLHKENVHWAGGYYALSRFFITAMRIEFCASVFNPAWLFERLKKKQDVFFLNGAPSLFLQFKAYYEENIENLPTEQKDEYIKGLSSIKMFVISGAPPPRYLVKFWERLTGKKIVTVYASTETNVVASGGVLSDSENQIGCNIGSPLPGCEMKISENGELLVKTPWQFLRYLSEDPSARTRAIDSSGFWRTGDLAVQKGPNFYILGRVSTDTIRVVGFSISTFEIEEALHTLPYIASATVLGVEDDVTHHRVAAIISLATTRHSSKTPFISDDLIEVKTLSKNVTLSQLRTDLHNLLPKFKLPTLLYTLTPAHSIPLTPTGKPSKILAKTMFFSPGYESSPQVEKLDLGTLAEEARQPGMEHRAWDWSGCGA